MQRYSEDGLFLVVSQSLILMQAVKKTLSGIVKTLAGMVNADWHDGYEEQAEVTCKWFKEQSRVAQSVSFKGAVFIIHDSPKGIQLGNQTQNRIREMSRRFNGLFCDNDLF